MVPAKTKVVVKPKRKRAERHWTYDTFENFWRKWRKLPKFPFGADGMARKLPPLHLWELACESYLKKRMPILEEDEVEEEMQKAVFLLECHEYSDPQGVRPRALLRILPLLNDANQRMTLYFDINEKIVPQNRPKTADLFLSIFSKESVAFQMEAFSKIDIKAEFFRPIGQYIVALAKGAINTGHNFGYFKMRRIKAIAKLISHDSKCFVCYRPLRPKYKHKGRCESCSKKTFHKWTKKMEKMRNSKEMKERERLFLKH